MSQASKPKPARERMREHRARLRAQGLRPVQFWVPDVDSPEFKAEAHRQSLAVATSPQAEEDQRFIDSITVGWGEE
ncbi:antitoxin MazE family protein [uncultured Enterovirga sp.]|uniref:antitoxin MazE family protein n=1 Tax=uncultured Enterovirga sp. TaxID=2026352 RepID=UPI0035CAC608